MEKITNIVYQIENKENGKTFIGYYCGRKIFLTSIRPGNKEIASDIKRLGKENFYYRILFSDIDKEKIFFKYKCILSKDFLLDKNTYNNQSIGRFTAKNKDGKYFYIYKDDPRYISGELVPATKGKIVVSDKENNFFSVSINDPRLKSGELFNNFKNKKIQNRKKKYYNSQNDPIWVYGDDKRVLSGELSRKKNKESGYLLNLKREFPEYDISFSGPNHYKINNRCSHSTSIIINKKLFKFRLKNEKDIKTFCPYCLNDYLKNYNLLDDEKSEYKKILDNLKPNQFSEKFINLNYPILHYFIQKTEGTSFKEKIYLWRNDLTEPPKCSLDNCNCHTYFLSSINKYSTYCKDHSYNFSLSSNAEKEIYEWISSIYKKEIRRNTRIANKDELDLFFPDEKLGIEYNGFYFHSDLFKNKNYHYEKWLKYREIGVNIITIWEDHWKNKKETIQSIIKENLGLNNKKVLIENLQIKEISLDESNKFLNSNYLFEASNSEIRLGLFENLELISIMTFRKLKDSIYELLEFSNVLDISIPESFQKLLNYFIEKNNPIEIISCLNLEIPNEEIFKKSGFIEENIFSNWWFAKNGIRFENEPTETKKALKIYGTGKQKFVYKNIMLESNKL